MRLLAGAAVAVLLLSSQAFAQTPAGAPSCGGFEPAPTLPDGASANRAAIERANAEYEAWSQARLARLRACKAEVDAFNDQVAAIYNPAKAELESVVAAWTVEVAEFNARGTSASNRRDRRNAANPTTP